MVYMDSIDELVSELMTEEIGKSILDSGSAYGYHYEENRANPPAKQPKYDVEDWNGVPLITKNLYHILVSAVDCDPATYTLTGMLREFMEAEDLYPVEAMEEFPGFLQEECGWDSYVEWGVLNTYNYCYPVSQGIQGMDLTITSGPLVGDYVILQIHGGCDVRGGYTLPVVVSGLMDDLIAEMSYITVACDKCGLMWEIEGDSELRDLETSQDVEPGEFRVSEGRLIHKCGSEVVIY